MLSNSKSKPNMLICMTIFEVEIKYLDDIRNLTCGFVIHQRLMTIFLLNGDKGGKMHVASVKLGTSHGDIGKF